MTNDYDVLNEDDVIIEGSDLHRALTNIGCTDFECTPVNRFEFHDNILNKINNPEDSISTIKHKWRWNFLRKIKDYCSLYKPKRKCSSGVAQLKIISQLEPLLDDHSMMIKNMLQEKIPKSREKDIIQWPIFIITNFILVTGTLLCKPLRISGFVAISFINALIAYHAYSELHSTKNLTELISLQNNIYSLYKRTLKILKNSYYLKLSQRHSHKQFSDLEIERVKYLPPMCEHFMLSMQNITRKCNQISLLLMNVSNVTCESNCLVNLVTKFNDTTFTIDGEITYEKLKQHYYIYILVQSEMMHLFAILYQDESINSCHLHLQFMKIINFLSQLFREQKNKLNNIIEQYKSCRAPTIHHELKNRVGYQLQDLYMHVDLLARKIQSAYNIVDSIIDDIDNCTNDDNTATIDSIIKKMNDAYKEIETARNFAEFNNLLIGKFRNNQTLKTCNESNPISTVELEKVLPIVHDTDPQIIDEVFEEYIKDEYLKPLYEDNDIDRLERGKLDKLLAKNFMSELKEVLIDKYKTMSERETRALLCYRRKMHNTESDSFIDNNCEENVPGIPPPPPPLPQSVIDESSCYSEEIKIRIPVPLPRSMNVTLNPTARARQKMEHNSKPGVIEANEQFFMNMNIHRLKLPAFTTNEETFIGSGENSDTEIIADDNPENENC